MKYAEFNQKESLQVVIVNYFKAAQVLEGIRSLLQQQTKFTLRISVIDNSCCDYEANILRDASARMDFDLNVSDKNLGYVMGCTTGLNSNDHDYILLMNPDICFTKKNDLQVLVSKFHSSPDMAILGCKQLNPDHSIEPVVRNFASIGTLVARRTFLKRFFKKAVDDYENLDFDYDTESTAPWLQSSMMLIRGKAYNDLGGLDRRFWLFMSDPDICLRAWKNGWKVVYSPEVVVHADGLRCSSGSWLGLLTSRPMRSHIIDAVKFDLKYFAELYVKRRLHLMR
jgi:GT2 family glycosyltransferase